MLERESDAVAIPQGSADELLLILSRARKTAKEIKARCIAAGVGMDTVHEIAVGGSDAPQASVAREYVTAVYEWVGAKIAFESKAGAWGDDYFELMSLADLPVHPTLADASDYVRRQCGNYTRMPAILHFHGLLAHGDWLTLLGKYWPGCDNVGQYADDLARLLPKRGPVTAMMTNDELAAWHALPPVVMAYRGTRHPDSLGASWSLDRSIAERFPMLHRYSGPNPAWLLTARIQRQHILAVKLDREEAEVIAFRGRRTVARDLIAEATEQRLEPGRK